MSAVMEFIAVSKCATIPMDHTTVFALMVMNSTVMAIHVKVSD